MEPDQRLTRLCVDGRILPPNAEQVSLSELALFFLRLGTTALGSLAGHNSDDGT
jgi:hypothetical protein